MTNYRREIDSLRREVRKLRQMIVQRPVKAPRGAFAPVYTLQITGGNVLSDGSTQGIIRSSSSVTSVPSAYNPNVDTSFIDGIGRGVLFIDGTQQSGFVLIAHHAGANTGLTLALPTGNLVLTSPATVQIPISGDPNNAAVTCYLAYTH